MIGTCEESRYIPFRLGGGGAHLDPEMGGGAPVSSFFRPQCLKIEGAPLLEPPL